MKRVGSELMARAFALVPPADYPNFTSRRRENCAMIVQ